MRWSFPVFLQTWICSQSIDVPETATQILHTGQAAEGPEHPSSQEEQMPAPMASKHLWKHMDAPGSSTHTQGLLQPGNQKELLIPVCILSIEKSKNSD